VTSISANACVPQISNAQFNAGMFLLLLFSLFLVSVVNENESPQMPVKVDAAALVQQQYYCQQQFYPSPYYGSNLQRTRVEGLYYSMFAFIFYV
jgi:hypothetical protein